MGWKRALWNLRSELLEEKVVHSDPNGETRGNALLGYLNQPVGWRPADRRLAGHSNRWESREVAVRLNSLGLAVDAIDFRDETFYPAKEYALHFDISTNLQRLAPFLVGTKKLLHITGSYPRYQNKAELDRVRSLEERTGMVYAPKRLVRDLELFDRSMRLADRCSLIGNEFTKRTIPEEWRSKVTLVTVTASTGYVKSSQAYVPDQREFLWFFGTGAVHKGLDRLLEVFKKHPEVTLNIIGNVSWEKDFMLIYGDIISNSPNIKNHGYVTPNTLRFREIADRCFCFLAPSCSEGISPAAATVMQAGLYPVISRDTGITLPEGCGKYLEDCSIEEIEQAVLDAHAMSARKLGNEISACQAAALKNYSREAFSRDMKCYLESSLGRIKN